MKKIIDIYIFKEMIPNFVTSLIVFTFLVLAGRTLRLTEWMVNHGISLVQVLLITCYTLPYVLFFTLPMATLLASLIAFSRLNEDNEIIALRSSGISLYQLFPPVITFSIICYLLASFMAIYLLPKGNHSMARLLFEVAQSNISIGIKQGVFNDTIPNIVLYANQISGQDQTMEGVFILDDRDPELSNTIIARKGRISSDPQQMSINLHLEGGSIFMVSKGLDASKVLRFKSYDLNIELSEIMKRFSSRMKGEKEMSLSELRRHLKEAEGGSYQHGDHRDLHRVDRRQRQMCIRDRPSPGYVDTGHGFRGNRRCSDLVGSTEFITICEAFTLTRGYLALIVKAASC